MMIHWNWCGVVTSRGQTKFLFISARQWIFLKILYSLIVDYTQGDLIWLSELAISLIIQSLESHSKKIIIALSCRSGKKGKEKKNLTSGRKPWLAQVHCIGKSINGDHGLLQRMKPKERYFSWVILNETYSIREEKKTYKNNLCICTMFSPESNQQGHIVGRHWLSPLH